ncbi:hypothetical protein BDQ12DRAFT_732971 [Crucibulum laeve]|uniref:F-box domain-containing protein n=1 Tax=Crucibulum laeve TaxID=68775 RepID=A0A5C3M9S1_9AGAR|nr:hypothetical protein BDQ12DRAFT_732971 [Crucibulum laeve]
MSCRTPSSSNSLHSQTVDPELEELTRLAEQLQVEEADLLAQERNITTQLVQNQTALVQLQTHLSNLQNARSVALSLPVSIATRIFVLSLELSLRGPYTSGNGRQKMKIPFEHSISHVSKKWREIALGTPSLWTWFNASVSGSADKLKAYLARSQDQLLALRLVSSQKATQDELVGVWRLLTPHAHRLRSLILDFSSASQLMVILSWMSVIPLPHLVHFAIECPNAYDDTLGSLQWSYVRSFAYFLRDAPSLQSLELNGILPQCIPWEIYPINKLRLRLPQNEFMLSLNLVLPSFASVTNLTLELYQALDGVSIVLPNLLVLKLVYNRPISNLSTDHSLFRAFSKLITPNVKFIDIRCQSGIHAANLFMLMSNSVSQNYHHLQFLSFSYEPSAFVEDRAPLAYREPGVLDVSNPFEYVEHLAFVNLVDTNALLAHVFLNPAYNVPRFPRLHTLTLEGKDLARDVTFDILTSRNTIGYEIAELRLSSEFADAEGNEECIEEWVELGFDIRIFDVQDFMHALDNGAN